MLLKKITENDLKTLQWFEKVYLLNEPPTNSLSPIRPEGIFAYFELTEANLLLGNYYLKDGIHMTS